jgi:hypothetical protein
MVSRLVNLLSALLKGGIWQMGQIFCNPTSAAQGSPSITKPLFVAVMEAKPAPDRAFTIPDKMIRA